MFDIEVKPLCQHRLLRVVSIIGLWKTECLDGFSALVNSKINSNIRSGHMQLRASKSGHSAEIPRQYCALSKFSSALNLELDIPHYRIILSLRSDACNTLLEYWVITALPSSSCPKNKPYIAELLHRPLSSTFWVVGSWSYNNVIHWLEAPSQRCAYQLSS
jgi:hypothetical protein